MSYPTDAERKAIAEAEALMVETMARYDPSHDAYHGMHDHVGKKANAYVRQLSVSGKPHYGLQKLSKQSPRLLPIFSLWNSRLCCTMCWTRSM